MLAAAPAVEYCSRCNSNVTTSLGDENRRSQTFGVGERRIESVSMPRRRSNSTREGGGRVLRTYSASEMAKKKT
jgi:hypothetical protein